MHGGKGGVHIREGSARGRVNHAARLSYSLTALDVCMFMCRSVSPDGHVIVFSSFICHTGCTHVLPYKCMQLDDAFI